jgi:putative SOS response-associated peptidase YedK
MCGRFVLTTPTASLSGRFEVEFYEEAPRYNIAPTQDISIIRLNPATRGRECVRVRWGLIPSWAKDASIGSRLLNARCETLHEKPAFKTSLKFKRCLIPSDGFYEWKRDGKLRQPFLLKMADSRPFAFAGLWDRWTSREGQSIQSCTIITAPANELIAPIHDRMPAILPLELYDTWLDPETKNFEPLLKLLLPFPGNLMVAVPVSDRVNKATYEGQDCIEPITLE